MIQWYITNVFQQEDSETGEIFNQKVDAPYDRDAQKGQEARHERDDK